MKSLLIALTLILFASTNWAQSSKLQEVVVAYYSVKDALIASNSTKASQSAKTFMEKVKNVSTTQFSEHDVKKWKKLSKDLLNYATIIATNSAIKTQRNGFGDLSIAMYRLLHTFHLNQQDVYYQYCPMADKYWLSKKKDIENPYYGSKMLTCGSVKATIKGNSSH